MIILLPLNLNVVYEKLNLCSENNLISLKIHYFYFKFNISIYFLENKISNELLWVDFDAFFWLLISVNYKILVLSIQKIDFVISEINSHIYQSKKLFE